MRQCFLWTRVGNICQKQQFTVEFRAPNEGSREMTVLKYFDDGHAATCYTDTGINNIVVRSAL